MGSNCNKIARLKCQQQQLFLRAFAGRRTSSESPKQKPSSSCSTTVSEGTFLADYGDKDPNTTLAIPQFQESFCRIAAWSSALIEIASWSFGLKASQAGKQPLEGNKCKSLLCSCLANGIGHWPNSKLRLQHSLRHETQAGNDMGLLS